MLAMRPGCECCDSDLPADTGAAFICSFECTFCAHCADTLLGNVCPNCGGGFAPRPIRPARNWKNGNCLANDPASATVKYRPADLTAHAELRARLADVPPQLR